jgi:hypothetical protein
MLFIAQKWIRSHGIPQTQRELDAIDLRRIRREFEAYGGPKGKYLARGTTMWEGWAASSIAAKQLQICLRNNQEYWPKSPIPASCIRDLSPLGIWTYIYGSFKYHQKVVADQPRKRSEELPVPVGILGLFLGDCAHTVMVTGIMTDEARILFLDTWQDDTEPSLLAPGENAAGVEAVRIEEHVWSVTSEEVVRCVLFYTAPKSFYKRFLRGIYGISIA